MLEVHSDRLVHTRSNKYSWLYQNNPERQKDLEESNNIYCVSEYAAEAISKYTNKKIRVIRNAVEDESESVLNIKIMETEFVLSNLVQLSIEKAMMFLLKLFNIA